MFREVKLQIGLNRPPVLLRRRKLRASKSDSSKDLSDDIVLPPIHKDVLRTMRKHYNRANRVSTPKQIENQIEISTPKRPLYRRQQPSNIMEDQREVTTPMYFYFHTSPPLERFRRFVEHVILWLRLYQDSSSQIREMLKFFTNFDLSDGENEGMSSMGSIFTPSLFRASKQAKVSHKILDRLKMDPSLRGPDDWKIIEASLRGYPAIADFPKDVTMQLARYAWYQDFGPYSVIVREGDWPIYYYFILTGTVIVSIIDRDKMMAQIVATLSRGDTFGELSIIYGTRRTSTVVAKEDVGLLILTDQEYKKIFLNGGERLTNDSFFTSLSCFYKFPMNSLLHQSTKVKFSFFRSKEVLVEDSKRSNWVFIIKSGSAQVKMPLSHSLLHEADFTDSLEDLSNVKRERHVRAPSFEQLSPNTIIQDHQTILRRQFRHHLTALESNKNELIKNDPLVLKTIEMPKLQMQSEIQSVGRQDTILDSKSLHRNRQKRTTTPSLSSNGAAAIVAAKIKKKGDAFINDRGVIKGRRTLATDLNMEYYQKLYQDKLRGLPDPEPVELIVIQTLTKGQIFGLTDFLFENQPSVKLVSEGCECFLIEKSLYFGNATEETLFRVGHDLRPYPTPEDVIKRRREERVWRSARKRTMKETLLALRREQVEVNASRDNWPTELTPETTVAL